MRMYYFEIAMAVAGIVLLAVGYRRNGRNLMLAGAIVLFLSGTLVQFAEGFRDATSGTVRAGNDGH
jgi:hypothetical protein